MQTILGFQLDVAPKLFLHHALGFHGELFFSKQGGIGIKPALPIFSGKK